MYITADHQCGTGVHLLKHCHCVSSSVIDPSKIMSPLPSHDRAMPKSLSWDQKWNCWQENNDFLETQWARQTRSAPTQARRSQTEPSLDRCLASLVFPGEHLSKWWMNKKLPKHYWTQVLPAWTISLSTNLCPGDKHHHKHQQSLLLRLRFNINISNSSDIEQQHCSLQQPGPHHPSLRMSSKWVSESESCVRLYALQLRLRYALKKKTILFGNFSQTSGPPPTPPPLLGTPYPKKIFSVYFAF